MAEVWDEKKCERISKRIATDGYGTPYPFPGYLQGYSWETELPKTMKLSMKNIGDCG